MASKSANYVDGFVLPVAKKNLPKYRRLASKGGKIFREHGALEFRECVGDDLNIKGMFSFLKLAKARPGETVMFSYIVYKSKAHRNQVMAKVMKDPRMTGMCDPKDMPFDFKRMACGGFKVLVKA